jgi:uncharacterized protein YndB with AHSA1/START domain
VEWQAGEPPPPTPRITVETTVAAPLARVWNAYTTPDDIRQWNAASDDRHTVAATMDLRAGGAFSSRMEAKDGSFGFDFAGIYTKVEPHSVIEYAEPTHSLEQQRAGWQAILNNFKRYVEARS